MPRITITLSEHQHKLFKSISSYTGKPMSASITELLESAMPVLERSAAVFQRLHEQKQREKERITNELTQVQDALEPIAAQFLNQFDMFLARVVPDDSQASDRPPAASFSERQPDVLTRSAAPRTNRGDTPPHDKSLKPASNKAQPSVKSSKVLKKNQGLNS